ncbi:hypothetical protein EH31_07265 [Erythrobacter longus]|uniref:Uncharacterized protein n=1 Tax=Erythrobacter longus TaxID=1044 RepID=A0A074MG43_ERYLO|nr:hypothetical protein EH31_07265 [Erythrobacter longus]
MRIGGSLDRFRRFLDWSWKAEKVFILAIFPAALLFITFTNIQSGQDPWEVATHAAIMFGLSIVCLGIFRLFHFFLHGVLDFIEVIGRKQ